MVHKHTINMGGRVLPFAITNRGLLQAEHEFEIGIPGDESTQAEQILFTASMIFAGTRNAKPRPTAEWIIDNLATLANPEQFGEILKDFFQSRAKESQQATSQNATAGLTTGDSPESI